MFGKYSDPKISPSIHELPRVVIVGMPEQIWQWRLYDLSPFPFPLMSHGGPTATGVMESLGMNFSLFDRYDGFN